MYAVVDIAGKQLQVSKGETVRVPRLSIEEGQKHTFTKVLLISDEGQNLVGAPHVNGASVTATVRGHGLEKKVIVFKIKRRKNYRRRNGHRQKYTEIQIDDIATA
jgi:large subunit ribosomal protein L21